MKLVLKHQVDLAESVLFSQLILKFINNCIYCHSYTYYHKIMYFCQQFSNSCRGTISPKQYSYCSNSSDVTLAEDTFGTFKNESGKTETVRRFTLSNKNGMRIEIINYGATITRLNVPEKTGRPEDVVLGFDNIEGWCLFSQHMVTCFILPLTYGIAVFSPSHIHGNFSSFSHPS